MRSICRLMRTTQTLQGVCRANTIARRSNPPAMHCLAVLRSDMVSDCIQVAGDSAVEELAAAQSAAEWRNTNALESSFNPCRWTHKVKVGVSFSPVCAAYTLACDAVAGSASTSDSPS